MKRTDPGLDRRRLLLYFGGLAVVYVIGVWALQPSNVSGNAWAIVVMLAPTAGALLARFAGPGVIVWGRPNLWILAGVVPILAGLAGYWVAALAGIIEIQADIVTQALTGGILNVATACLVATGEEIGWRGFLWPLTRRRLTFLPATLVVTAIWWLYHVPVILLGWYGSLGGVAAFTVGILGFGAFVGVVTDRSRGIWASVLAHGGWNALVATSFGVAAAGGDIPGFSGDPALLGEFGWIAAISMAILGAVTVAWHLATGGGHRNPYPGDTWVAGTEPKAPEAA